MDRRYHAVFGIAMSLAFAAACVERPDAGCRVAKALPYGRAVQTGDQIVCPAPPEWFITAEPAPVAAPAAALPPAGPAERPPVATAYLVFFAPGSKVLSPDAAAVIDAAIKGALKRDTHHIRVIGHSDGVGGPIANLALSLERAETVRAHLREGGLDKVDITATGRGFRQPLVPGRGGNAQNRRVEIRLLD